MVFAIVLLAAVLPAFVILYFIYRKDNLQHEPAGKILAAFGLGALSVLVSFCISIPLLHLGVIPAHPATVIQVIESAFWGAAIPEEIAKFVLLWLFLRNNRYYDEWVDGIVYAACIGLGFAALENIEYLFHNIGSWAFIAALRGVISVPAHFFFAVTMGYFYSKAKFGDPSKKVLNVGLAVLIPIILHGLFDFLVIISRGTSYFVAFLCLLGGLYLFMAVKSRRYYTKHYQKDLQNKA